MEVSTGDKSIKEYLSKYPLNEQSTVASKLTKIGISYIIKTNGSQRFPSLRELETIINTLCLKKGESESIYQKKKGTAQKAKPKAIESQLKTPSFGKKREEPMKRAQTVEGKQVKGNSSNNFKKDNAISISQSKKGNQVTNDKRIKAPIIFQPNLKPQIAEKREEKIEKQPILNENSHQEQKMIIEENKADTPQSIKRMINSANPIEPNPQIKTPNYHFQPDTNITHENKFRDQEGINQYQINNEKNESTIKTNQKEPQIMENKLKYDYQPVVTQPPLTSSGYSFRQSNTSSHRCNCSHHLSCHCNHNHNYHYPQYSYHSPTDEAINTESSLGSFAKRNYNFTDVNTQSLLSKYSFPEKYEPRSSFTYEISNR